MNSEHTSRLSTIEDGSNARSWAIPSATKPAEACRSSAKSKEKPWPRRGREMVKFMAQCDEGRPGHELALSARRSKLRQACGLCATSRLAKD